MAFCQHLLPQISVKEQYDPEHTRDKILLRK